MAEEPLAAVPARVIERLGAARGFVLDLDGTLVLGDRRNRGFAPLPGALALTRLLARRQVPYVVFTNGTTQTPRQYAAALRRSGFELDAGQVLTPVVSALDVLTRRRQARVMVLGTDGLTGPLADAGLEVLPPAGQVKVDAVLVGWYREFTMDALEAACHAVWGGAACYTCSSSVFFATAEGKVMTTSRAIAAMVRSMTGCRVEVVGKPSLQALRTAGRRLGAALRELAVVGDDPELEVPMAHRGGSLAVAVASGVAGADEFARLPARRRPHLSVHGVDQLLALYEEACRRADGGGSKGLSPPRRPAGA
ncbi:MAG TPA: HAD hydrolase-like protein [Actinomycetes bacterium]